MSAVVANLPKRFWKQDWFKDLIFVLVLPTICLLIDPVVFVEANEAVTYAAYILFPTLMACFYATSWFGGTSFFSSILEGTLLLGAGLALAVGLLLLPLTIIGLFFLIGALGLVPFFTAKRFYKRYQDLRNKFPEDFTHPFGIILGLTLPFLLPAIVHNHITKQQTALFAQLGSATPEDAQKALAKLPVTWHCSHDCLGRVSSQFEAGQLKLTKAELDPIFMQMTGQTYDEFLYRLLD